jgi:hypothetical protein
MNAKEYFEKLNEQCQDIFVNTIQDPEPFGNVHHIASCLFEFSETIEDVNERELLNVVSAQIEASSINLALGLYRQAFSSLRLALELGLGVIYFSIYKLEYREWLNGRNDIKWAKLIDHDNGVLSLRLTEAFFPELSASVIYYNNKARAIYRKMSEFVHGNYETWKKSGLNITKNDELIAQYFSNLSDLKEVLMFCLACRYINSFSAEKKEAVQFLAEELGHIEAIRVKMGGPEDK